MKSAGLDLSSLEAPHIGIDEVGRGCLAGPVTAAAVILKSNRGIQRYQDSKTIKEEHREIIAAEILENHHVAIGWATVEEIDELNILQATFLAMTRAVQLLQIKSGTILVDGRDKIPNLVGFKQRPVIQGDKKVRVISAASIVAKVARDQFMKDLAKEFHEYGFEKHKGYGTLYHRQQIQRVGPSQWHRQSFGGVKEFIGAKYPVGLSR